MRGQGWNGRVWQRCVVAIAGGMTPGRQSKTETVAVMIADGT